MTQKSFAYRCSNMFQSFQSHDGSMVLLYMVTFTINISPMFAYIPAPWIHNGNVTNINFQQQHFGKFHWVPLSHDAGNSTLRRWPRLSTGWWYTYPSEKYESQLGWLFPIYGKKICSKPPISSRYNPGIKAGKNIRLFFLGQENINMIIHKQEFLWHTMTTLHMRKYVQDKLWLWINYDILWPPWSYYITVDTMSE